MSMEYECLQDRACAFGSHSVECDERNRATLRAAARVARDSDPLWDRVYHDGTSIMPSRSEVPEPSAAHGTGVDPKWDKYGGLPAWATENESEPQGEPSDAEVKTEALRKWPHDPDDANVASARAVRRLSFLQGALWMRAALRAAGNAR